MKKIKFNAYLPIWFILIIPPAIILMLAFNGALSIVGLVVACIYAGLEKTFNRYTKGLLRTYIIAFVADIMAVILYLLPELLFKNDYINEHLINHLEYDSYGSILSILYMIFLIAIVETLTFLLIKKFVTKKLQIEKNKSLKFTLFVLLFISPYMFYLPSNLFLNKNKSNLEDFKGTMLIDNSDIKSLLKHINTSENISSYVLDKKSNPYILDIYIDDKYNKNPALYFEYDSALIFNLISDINKITFHYKGEKYKYTINSINDKFYNIKKKSITDINNEYSSYMYTKYTYMGHYKTYDIFNHSKTCDPKYFLIDVVDDPYSDEIEKTYIECGTDETVYFLDDKGEHTLKDLLAKEEFTVWDLTNSSPIKFHYEYKNDEKSNN